MTVCPVTIKHEKLILRGRCFNDLRLFSSDAFILSYSKNRPHSRITSAIGDLKVCLTSGSPTTHSESSATSTNRAFLVNVRVAESPTNSWPPHGHAAVTSINLDKIHYRVMNSLGAEQRSRYNFPSQTEGS